MSRLIVGALLLTLLSGCDDWAPPPPASITHTCTEPQMVRVQTETSWCDAHTGYLSTYCYDSAIVRNCTVRAALKP